VFEKRILGKIFGPTTEDNGNWRTKTNKQTVGRISETLEHNKLC
jgi:hypothetical protein